MRRRGVKRPVLADVRTFRAPPASFDAAVLYGCNLGLAGTALGLEVLLARLAALVRPGGLLVGTQVEVLQTDRPAHLDFHARNRALGREAGETWLRVERDDRRGPWFPWFLVGSEEVSAAAERAGFAVERVLHAPSGPLYALVARRRS